MSSTNHSDRGQAPDSPPPESGPLSSPENRCEAGAAEGRSREASTKDAGRANRFWAAVNALCSLGLLAVAIFAIRSDESIARRSGALESGVLEVSIGNHPLGPDQTEVVVGVSPTLAEAQLRKTPVIGRLPFVLHNTGAKTLEDVSATFRYPPVFNRQALEYLDISPTGGIKATQIEHRYSENFGNSYSAYGLPSLDPSAAFGIFEPIFLRPTSQIVPDLPVGDSLVDVQVNYSLLMQATFGAKDIRAVDCPLSITVVFSDSLNELKVIATKKVVGRRLQEVRESLSFFSYLSRLLARSDTESVALVQVETERHEIPGGEIYFATDEQPAVSTLTYDVVQRAWLFR